MKPPRRGDAHAPEAATPPVPQAVVPWSVRTDGLRITVRVTPKARRSAVAGVGLGADGRPALLVSVAAPPVDGAANEAVVSVLAKALRLGRSAVTVQGGAASRHKILDLRGDPASLGAALEALLATLSPD